MLVTEHDIDSEEIERIHVEAAQSVADVLHHADPDTDLDSKFSQEYMVVSAAARDRAGLADFDYESSTTSRSSASTTSSMIPSTTIPTMQSFASRRTRTPMSVIKRTPWHAGNLLSMAKIWNKFNDRAH